MMAELRIKDKPHLVCIEYPAIVKNEEKLLKSLGGEKTITEVCNNPSIKLALRFRPDDPFCKPAFAVQQPTKKLLLKVRRKKKKPAAADDDVDSGIKVEVLGIIDTVFQFQGMADFQFLAAKRKQDNTFEPLVKDVTINKIEAVNDVLSRKSPLFLPPSLFSRFDMPVPDYHFRDGPKHKPGYVDPMKDKPSTVIGVTRPRRGHNAIYLQYGKPIPNEPIPAALKDQDKPQNIQRLAVLDKLFEERPIWSRQSLVWRSAISNDSLKFLLPMRSYYYSTGPWRSCWIKFGFDPSKNPTAKMLQVLDFRARAEFMENVQIKRKSVSRNAIYTAKNQEQVGLINVDSLDAVMSGKDVEPEPEAEHEFHPDRLPNARQSYYHLCDIHMPAAQELIHQNTGQESECTERDGWCLPFTMNKLRNLLADAVSKLLSGVKPDQITSAILDTEETEDISSDSEKDEESEGVDEEQEQATIEDSLLESQQVMSVLQAEANTAKFDIASFVDDKSDDDME